MSAGWQIAVVTLWVFALGLALVLVATLRHIGVLHVALRGPARGMGPRIGDEAPAFSGHDLLVEEETFSSRDRGDRAGLFAFLSPDCGGCEKLVPHLNAFATARSDVDVTALLPLGAEEGRKVARRLGLKTCVLGEHETDAFAAYNVQLTPHIVVVDIDGRVVASGAAHDEEELLRLTRAVEPVPQARVAV